MLVALAENCGTLPACCDAGDTGVVACVLPGVTVVKAARNGELASASDGTDDDDAVVVVVGGVVDPVDCVVEMIELVDAVVDEVVDVVFKDVAGASSAAVSDSGTLEGVMLEGMGGLSPRSARRRSAARAARFAVVPPVSNCGEDIAIGATRNALPANGEAD